MHAFHNIRLVSLTNVMLETTSEFSDWRSTHRYVPIFTRSFPVAALFDRALLHTYNSMHNIIADAREHVYARIYSNTASMTKQYSGTYQLNSWLELENTLMLTLKLDFRYYQYLKRIIGIRKMAIRKMSSWLLINGSGSQYYGMFFSFTDKKFRSCTMLVTNFNVICKYLLFLILV